MKKRFHNSVKNLIITLVISFALIGATVITLFVLTEMGTDGTANQVQLISGLTDSEIAEMISSAAYFVPNVQEVQTSEEVPETVITEVKNPEILLKKFALSDEIAVKAGSAAILATEPATDRSADDEPDEEMLAENGAISDDGETDDDDYDDSWDDDDYDDYDDYDDSWDDDDDYDDSWDDDDDYDDSWDDDYGDYDDDYYDLGQEIVDYAMGFVGVTPYVSPSNRWTGDGYWNDLYAGTDCSGFVHLIFEHFGIYLPTGSDPYQSSVGYHISYEELRPGDLIVYGYGAHVVIYAGDDMVINCSNPERGTVYDNMWYKEPTAYVRVID